jgi:hypothetical protein
VDAYGSPAAVVTSAGSPVGVLVVDVGRTGDRAQTIYLVANPEKLAGWQDAGRPSGRVPAPSASRPRHQ